MDLILYPLKNNEWILLHDFYCESSEPDAPKCKFYDLDEEGKSRAELEFSSNHYRSIFDGNVLVGFVGFFPDDGGNVNLFCVLSPEQRGKGYFSRSLKVSLDQCRTEFADHKYIRVLTRKENEPAVKGFERFAFIRIGEVVEDVQPEIAYEEYLLPIQLC